MLRGGGVLVVMPGLVQPVVQLAMGLVNTSAGACIPSFPAACRPYRGKPAPLRSGRGWEGGGRAKNGVPSTSIITGEECAPITIAWGFLIGRATIRQTHELRSTLSEKMTRRRPRIDRRALRISPLTTSSTARHRQRRVATVHSMSTVPPLFVDSARPAPCPPQVKSSAARNWQTSVPRPHRFFPTPRT
jgi:hypothetical protein